MHRLPATLAFISAIVGTAASARAQDFYQGRTVNVIVGNTPSSGYDPYARLLARHMMRHLPGKPTMIVQNMPGAGSVKAAEYTYLLAPKDGTAFTLVMPGAFRPASRAARAKPPFLDCWSARASCAPASRPAFRPTTSKPLFAITSPPAPR